LIERHYLEVVSWVSCFLLKLPDIALFPQLESIRSYQNLLMATFTSVPQATSSQFKHYDPTLLKRIKSKAKAKVTGHTTCKDHIEAATYSLGFLHQGIISSSVMQATRTRLTRVQIPRVAFMPSLDRHHRSRQQAILQILRR
jgi:hypothetical protein